MNDAITVIAGEAVHLLSARGLYWPKERTLFVADVHLGKAATFRHYGIAVPAGTTTDNLDRLSAVLKSTGADRLIILGDLFHSRAGQTESMLAALAEWRTGWSSVSVQLVTGNHDKRSALQLAEASIEIVGDELLLPPFLGTHHPVPSDAAYVLAGHVHPAVRLSRAGQRNLTLSCFYVTPTHTILPAFGAFTGTFIVTPTLEDRVFVIAGDDVVEASA